MATANIILAGLAGSGKSSVGRELARLCGLEFLDLDRDTERLAGTSIRSLAAQERWAEFRLLETRALKALEGRQGLVLALGGGTLLNPENQQVAKALGTLVQLDAPDRELAHRLELETHLRPLLAGASGEELVQRVATLRRERQAGFGVCTLVQDTSGLAPRAIARSLALRLGLPTLELALGDQGAPRHPAQPQASSVLLQPGASCHPGLLATHCHPASTALVLSDQTVASLHGAGLCEALSSAGLRHRLVVLPPGEASKSLASVQEVLAEAAAFGLQRDGLVIGFGGGVICDLAALCAGLYMRGLRLLQLPSTLLAMVDAAHGGKAAVDFAGHKNLLGQFWFPWSVVLDPDLLATLPPRELRSGLGEVLKAALLGDPALLALLETRGRAVLEDPRALDELIRRALAVKLAIVQEDPLEGGRRALLNFGHSLGHALEAEHSPALSHGEAVGLGMLLETRLALHLGLCSPGLPMRVQAALSALGLPTTPPPTDPEALLEHLYLDKKNSAGALRMVLPRAVGDFQIGVAVPRAPLEGLLAGDGPNL